ncbi:MAG: AsmA-like C-terminal region-containing protein [Saprospiraceae bacterium]|nr:AsmA-like C-terminal region-containing protein [Saprospiraceae bacterium]MDW8229979.1 AsmA-like C-terminal region-containing protein [Saprospiraceae bacterium]
MSETPSLPPRRRRWWKRLLLWVGLPLLLLVIVLVVVAAVFNEQITRRLLDAVDDQLRTELTVRKAGLSLLRRFPEASVNLEDVQLKDAFGRYLLQAREVSFRFRLFSLFGERIEVKKVVVSGGSLNVRIDARGRANYDIFKESPSEAPSGSNDLRLALESAELKNLFIIYENANTRQTASINLKNAGLAGDFAAQQFALSSQADMTVARLQVGDSRYLVGQPLRYNAVVAVDLAKGLYDLQNVELVVGGNAFDVSGFVSDKGEYSDLNVQMKGREGDISLVIALLPEPYSGYFRDFQSSGAYTFSAFVHGRASKTQLPTVGVEATLRNGMVSSEKLQSPLRNVSFRATYSAPPSGQGVFEIADFQANFGGQPLGFQLKITDLDDPMVDFRLQGALPLKAAYGLLNNPRVSGGDGLVRIPNLSVQGRYADMTSMQRIAHVRAEAEVQFDAAALTYNGTQVELSSGRIVLQDNLLRSDSVQMQIGRSDLLLHGYAQNLLPVLFADSLNTQNAQLEFNARLRGRFIDVGQLLDLFAVSEEEASGDEAVLDSMRIEANRERQRLTERLRGVFEANFDAFEYRKIRGQQFGGLLAFDRGTLNFRLGVQAMQGSAQVNGVGYFAQRPSLKMRITLQAVDLRTLMEQCDNFDQDVITHENLRGTLSGRVVAYAFWDESNHFLMDQLRALADVRATNGELVGVKMLEDFSTFIHIEDLRRIRFADLQNYLEIKNRTLYLPVMFIQSNALNLTLSGTHTFDNDIDYRLKVNAGQVVLNRIKRHDPDLDPLPARDGWFNVFYTIRGNIDKYDMKRGKREVVREFERSEALKKSLAQRIEDEFRGIDGRPLPPTAGVENERARPGAVPTVQ